MNKGLIHNITFLVAHSVHAEWQSWIKKTIFPYLDASKEITTYRLCKIVSAQNPDGISFALQLEFENVTLFQQFAATLEPVMLNNLREQFQDSALYFATTIDILD